MTKRTRTILFLICLLLFLLITPTTIFYSQGYRFDFKNKRLTQTGGLFLKAEPKAVEIYINGQLVKKTDFFFGSALIENLLPKRYKVEVKKEGYFVWEKNLEIREKEVTEVKNIVLFLKNPNFEILTKEVKNLWFSPDEKKIILSEVNEQGLWALKLFDLERNIKSHLIQEVDVYSNYIPPLHPPASAGPSGADLMNLEFSEDSKEIYLDIRMKDSSPPTILPLTKGGWSPQEKKFILKLDKFPPILTEKILKEELPRENIITSKKINNDVYHLDNFGHFFKNGEKLTEKSFPVKLETEYALEIFQNFIFLKEGQILYQFIPQLKSFEKFFEGINDLKISPDNKKLVFFSNSEIWILFLKAEGTKKAGEKLFLIRLSEKIGDIFWLNSDYLIFNSGDYLKIVEIDDRDRIQTWDIPLRPNFGVGADPKIYFNQSNKKLYILSKGNLYDSEKLIR